MTKKELIDKANTLEEGQVLVCCTNTKYYILVGNTLLSENGYMPLSEYDDNLNTVETFTINKVYIYQCGCGYNNIISTLSELRSYSSSSLIWERPVVVELTMDMIAKKFGIPVSQLKIKK